jgi:hypothetical protein
MPRPQFSLKTMLWMMVVTAAFCAGTRSERFLAERRPDPMETRIWAALDEHTELDFTDQPLSDVIEYLQQRHAINVQLDNKALRDAGVASDTPITRSIKGITLRSALRLFLGDVGLTYAVRNGILTITTSEALYPWLRLKTMLWLVAVVAAFLAGDRAWRRQTDKSKAQAQL